MQITRTSNGLMVTGAQYLPDGTTIPFKYNPAQDAVSAPEMKAEAQAILTYYKNEISTGSIDVDGNKKPWTTREGYNENFLERKGFLDTYSVPKILATPRVQKYNTNARKVSKTTSKKRILNPLTGKYYELRQRTTKNGVAGQIKGLWSPKKGKKE